MWVDRLDRRQVLVWTQALSMVQSLALAALTLTGHITIPLVLALSVMQGMSTPSTCRRGRRSWSRWWRTGGPGERHRDQFVDGEMARLVGPSLAGMVIAVQRGLVLSDRWHQLHRRDCLAADDALHAAGRSSAQATSMLTELQDGWTYVAGLCRSGRFCCCLRW